MCAGKISMRTVSDDNSQALDHDMEGGNSRLIGLATLLCPNLTGKGENYKRSPIGEVAEWLKAAVC